MKVKSWEKKTIKCNKNSSRKITYLRRLWAFWYNSINWQSKFCRCWKRKEIQVCINSIINSIWNSNNTKPSTTNISSLIKVSVKPSESISINLWSKSIWVHINDNLYIKYNFLRNNWEIQAKELLELIIPNANTPSLSSEDRSLDFKVYSGSIKVQKRLLLSVPRTGLSIPISVPPKDKSKLAPSRMSRPMAPILVATSTPMAMMSAWSRAEGSICHPTGPVLRLQEIWPTVQLPTDPTTTDMSIPASTSKLRVQVLVNWVLNLTPRQEERQVMAHPTPSTREMSR